MTVPQQLTAAHAAATPPRTPEAAQPDPAAAAAYFAASLAFHTDVSDVAAAVIAGADTAGDPGAPDPGFTLVDTRSTASWDQGHIPGAVHLPTAQIPDLAPALLDPARPVVVYCWGPACNGATRAAFALASLGYQVKEMLGGMEYWIREGLPYETWQGPAVRPADPLTAPAADDCGC